MVTFGKACYQTYISNVRLISIIYLPRYVNYFEKRKSCHFCISAMSWNLGRPESWIWATFEKNEDPGSLSSHYCNYVINLLPVPWVKLDVLRGWWLNEADDINQQQPWERYKNANLEQGHLQLKRWVLNLHIQFGYSLLKHSNENHYEKITLKKKYLAKIGNRKSIGCKETLQFAIRI